MTQSVVADPGHAVLAELGELLERHRDQAVSLERLPELLNELGAVLRRGRSAVRRAAQASKATAPAAPPAKPQPQPQPPAKETAPAPVPSPPAQQTTGATRGDSPRDQADRTTGRRRGGSRLLGVIVTVGLIILAGLVLALAGAAFGADLGGGRCPGAHTQACADGDPPGVGR